MTPPSCLPNVVAMTIVHSVHVPRETKKRRRENEKTQRRDIQCCINEGRAKKREDNMTRKCQAM